MSKKQQVKAAPIILDIHDGQQTVPNGGTTDAAQLTLSGSAQANSVILLYDHEAPVGSASVTINSTWAITLSVEMGEHRFTARTTSGVSSAPWVVRRQDIALTIDTSIMVLDGTAIKSPAWTPTGVDAPGNAEVRTATGGRQPYIYSSSHPDVASVSAQGKVTGERNGLAVITVEDSRQQSVSYIVNVSNVWVIMAATREGGLTYRQAEQSIWHWYEALPSIRFLFAHELTMLFQYYERPFELSAFNYWIKEASGNPAPYAYFNKIDHRIILTTDPATPNIQGYLAVVDWDDVSRQKTVLEVGGERVKRV